MTNAALVHRASRAVVVADSSKLGCSGFARVCDVAAIDTLITDEGASDEQIAEFVALGVNVTRV
jgi:DeoR family transcriptional regulator, aga operon transcriptional repressor